MEFNVVDENNKFKVGNIISIFKLPNYNNEFALFSVSDFIEDEASLHVAYLLKDSEGYDYVEEIKDPKVLKDATEAVKEMIKVIG
jgi:hypothetical protein